MSPRENAAINWVIAEWKLAYLCFRFSIGIMLRVPVCSLLGPNMQRSIVYFLTHVRPVANNVYCIKRHYSYEITCMLQA